MQEIFSQKYDFKDFSQITACGGPVWHPTDNELFFISNMTGNFQIYQTRITENVCSWPNRLTYSNNRTTVPTIDASGRLYFLTDSGGDEKWQIHFLEDLSAKNPLKLTDRSDRIHRLNVIKNNKVFFSSNRVDPARFDLFEIDMSSKDKDPVLLVENTLKGLLKILDVSPDGNLLLCHEYLSINIQKFYIYNFKTNDFSKIAITDSDAWSGGEFIDNDTILCISNFNRDFSTLGLLKLSDNSFSYLEPESENWDTDYFFYHPSTGKVVWSKNCAGFTEIYIASLNRKLIDKIKVPLPTNAVVGAGDYRTYLQPFSLNNAGNLLAVNIVSSTSTQNIFIIDLLNNFNIWKATNTGSGIIPESIFTPASLKSVQSFDSLSFDFYFYNPNQGNNKLPCIIIIHGGPEGQALPAFDPLIQFFCYNGFAVAVPNVRGSSGYGKRFNQLDDVRLRMNSVKDIASLVDTLKTLDSIDENKIIVYGGSYGGFMVLSAITEYPELFAAGIDVVGIANFVTFLENTAPWRRKLRESEYGSLENDREFLADISPIKKVDQIKCPTLIIHGKNDERVPVSEAHQMYEQLKSRNIPTELLIFDDEGHGVIKAENKLKTFKTIIEFLSKHV